MVRKFIIGAVGLAIVAALVMAMTSQGAPVEVAQARLGEIRSAIEEQAKTSLPHVYSIAMPATGRIEPITLTEGAPVSAGMVVAQMNKFDLETAVAEGQAKVEQLEAKIVENDDTRLEETGLKQVQRILESMDRAVEAALEKTKSSQARKDYAATKLRRTRELFEKKSVPRDELDRDEVEGIESEVDFRTDQLTLRATEAIAAAMNYLPLTLKQSIEKKSLTHNVLVKEKAQAEANLARLRRDLERGVLRSPVDGVVLSREYSNERVLNAGTVLLEIGRLDELEVEAEVLSPDVVEVRPGMPVDIHGPSIGAEPLKGTVKRVYPRGFTKISSLGVEQQRVKVIVGFDPGAMERLVQESRFLGVDYRVKIRIYTVIRQDALIVPRTAIFRGPAGQWQAFALRDGRAVLTPVEIGLETDDQVEIVSGLEAGDLVVLAPDSSLQSGQRVEPIGR